MIPTEAAGHDNENPWQTRRLWSLADMMDWSLHAFVGALQVLSSEMVHAARRAHADPTTAVSDEDRERLMKNLEYITRECRKLSLGNAENRLGRIYTSMRTGPGGSYGEVASELNILTQAIHDDIQVEYFYHYPRARGLMVLTVAADWSFAVKSFPELNSEIRCAIDCYALGHNLACVFYLMRVMEIGVQRLGAKFKVKLKEKTQRRLVDLTWHQILDRLHPKFSGMAQKTVAQKAKFENYRAIQSHLNAVKDAWRNPTMHPRVLGYSDLQTLDLINHVRAFMNGLAEIL